MRTKVTFIIFFFLLFCFQSYSQKNIKANWWGYIPMTEEDQGEDSIYLNFKFKDSILSVQYVYRYDLIIKNNTNKNLIFPVDTGGYRDNALECSSSVFTSKKGGPKEWWMNIGCFNAYEYKKQKKDSSATYLFIEEPSDSLDIFFRYYVDNNEKEMPPQKEYCVKAKLYKKTNSKEMVVLGMPEIYKCKK